MYPVNKDTLIISRRHELIKNLNVNNTTTIHLLLDTKFGICDGYSMDPNAAQTKHRTDDQLIDLLTVIWHKKQFKGWAGDLVGAGKSLVTGRQEEQANNPEGDRLSL